MAFSPTYATDGSGFGPLLVMHKDDLRIVNLGITFGGSDTYVTGGMTITLPDEISERAIVEVLLTKNFHGSNEWRWDGSRTTPKLLAYSAFATELSNGTSIASHSLRAVLLLK